MTTPLSGYSDEDLLIFLNTVREQRGRIEQEIQARFAARGDSVIATERWTATQRTDTTRYVFSESDWESLQWLIDEGIDITDQTNAARQISRKYVSLSKNETTEERPL